MPLVLACAGMGTYNCPYFIDMQDELVKAGLACLGIQWETFLLELNSILRMVRLGQSSARARI